MSWLNLNWIHPKNKNVSWIFFALFFFTGLINIYGLFLGAFGSTGFFDNMGLVVLISSLFLFLISELALFQIKWFALISFIIILLFLIGFLQAIIYLFFLGERQFPLVHYLVGFGVIVIPFILNFYVFNLSLLILKDKRYSFKERLDSSNRWKRIIVASLPFFLFLYYLSFIEINI